ncbi:hypothetical protein KKG29_05645 [Patescibacteria group bacterium]|nr:hypothetical protein [Patescibacteria group bacterium]
MKEKSDQYAKDTDGRAFIIHALRSPETESAIVAIAEKTKRTLYLANIVPKKKQQLSMDEYNQIASNFFNAFRQHLKGIKSRVSIRITKENIGLEEIIPGKLTRKYFERYMSAYPLSFHPLDVERLDFFICALFRYRSRVDVTRLKRYLIEDIGWQEKDASWCTRRVETGLDILKANWGFH